MPDSGIVRDIIHPAWKITAAIACSFERGMLKDSVPAQRKKKKQKERIDRV
jgi:hypothetical protein